MGIQFSSKRLCQSLAVIVGFSVVAVAAMTFERTTEISSDPYTAQSQKTEVEPDTYSYGSTLVTAFQVGRFSDGGALDIGWATSQDNGKTWHHGFLPGVTKYQDGGQYDRISDASVAYDAKHGVWMVSSLAIYDGSGNNPFTGGMQSPAIIVSRSTDGINWQNPVAVYSEGQTGSLDKNWTTCDNWPSSPYYGNCYTEWDAPEAQNQIAMSTSSDGGITWGAPLPTADHASGLGGQPVVQPNGTVIVPIGDADLANLQSFISTDGGKSWSATTQITNLDAHDVSNKVRTEPLPSATVDSSGKVYVVWQDCRFESNCSANDMVMATTTDGLNWTPVARIPTEPVGSDVDHFIPGIAADRAVPAGQASHLSLTYYYYPKADCSGSDCKLRVATVSSLDGGASWSQPIAAGQLAVDWNAVPATTMGVMVGDYISSSFVADGVALPVFALSTDGKGLTMNSIVPTPASTRDLAFTPVTSEPVRVSEVRTLSVPLTPQRKFLRLF